MIQEEGQTKYYISLQQATKFCNYSQEYLSLRARQGKLKSLKLGRNWVTTKEWLEEYLSSNGNGNAMAGFTKSHKFVCDFVNRKIEPPYNLPVEPDNFFPQKIFKKNIFERFRTLDLKPRTSFIFALVFIMIAAGGVFGKENFLSAYKDISPRIDSGISEILSNLSGFRKSVSQEEIFVGGASVTVGDAAGSANGIILDYAKWAGRQIKQSYLVKNYIRADKFLEQGLAEDFQNLSSRSEILTDYTDWAGRQIKQSYLVKNYIRANKFLEKGFSSGFQNLSSQYASASNYLAGKGREAQKFAEAVKDEFLSLAKKGYQFAASPLRNLISKVLDFKKESVVVERVEVSKVVEPVKEITRQVETVRQITKIDDVALAEIRATMAYLEVEMGKRLYAPGGVISQTIYTKEPVSSPKIYQENGEIVLQTIGSGNVILSAATGLQLYGSQVVIESTSKLSPMIYLANNSRIGGDLAVTGAANVSGALGIGGTASVSGNLNVGGDFTVSGAQNFSGAMTITASSTPAVLTVSQTGTGDILNLKDGSTEVFTVIDGGNVGIATSTPSAVLAVGGDIMGSGNVVFYGSSVTTTISGGLTVGNNVGIGIASPQEKLVLSSGSNFAVEMAAPSGISGTTIAGTLATSTYYIKIAASDGAGTTVGSSEYSTTTGGSQGVQLSWTAPTGASSYRVYVGDSSGGQDRYFTATNTTYWLSTTTANQIAGAAPGATTAFVSKLIASGNSWFLGGNIGIATTTPRYLLDVWGDLAVGTSTDINTPALYVDSGNGGRVGIGTTTLSGLLTVGTTTPALVVDASSKVGIATTSPFEKFSVAGNIYGSGNLTITGNFMPVTPQGQNIGSAAVDWQNIYAANVYANNINAGSSTISGNIS
ncbi:MAG: hypothetical protein HYT20_00675 [Candidatus Nealsonbacteria bacterium]|nr:hypothetical protein [Candidatus Nealsonbacteria bacterium]